MILGAFLIHVGMYVVDSYFLNAGTNASSYAIQAHALHVPKWFVMIVIVAILLQQLDVVSKNDGRVVSHVAKSLTVININVRILATRVIVYLAIRQVCSFVNAVVNKRHVTVQVLRGNVKKNVENL